jgi:hypothetical protein
VPRVFTLEKTIRIEIQIFFPVVDFNPLTLVLIKFLGMLLYKIKNFHILKKSGQKVDMKPLNVHQKIFGDENQAIFLKLILTT